MARPVYGNQQRGIVLISVLIVSAVGLGISVFLLLLAITSARSVIMSEQSTKARAYADACAEYALNALHQSSTFAGSITLTFSDGTCQILSVLGSGNNDRTVRTKGLVGDAVRKVEVEISQTAPQLITSSWQEVADFLSPE